MLFMVFTKIQSAGLLSHRVQTSNSPTEHVYNLERERKCECIEFIDEWEIRAKQIMKTNHVETYNWNEPHNFWTGYVETCTPYRDRKRKEDKIYPNPERK